MAHLHYVEDETGDVVDHLVFCSDYCHKQHMDEKYRGWNGCNEISTTEPCVECGSTVEGLDEGEEREMINISREEYVELHSRHSDSISKRQPDPNRPKEVAQYFIGDDLFLESHKDKADKSIWGQTYYLSP